MRLASPFSEDMPILSQIKFNGIFVAHVTWNCLNAFKSLDDCLFKKARFCFALSLLYTAFLTDYITN